jgi:hypothetical protein
MKLNISEHFLILALHPEKPHFIVTQPALNAGFIGSVFLDLSVTQQIEMQDATIAVTSQKQPASGIEGKILKAISESQKPRKARRWIAKFSQKARRYRLEVMKDLEKKGYVKIEHRSFLFIPYHRFRLINKPYRLQLAMDLRNAIIQGKTDDPRKAALLGLVKACKMQKTLSTDRNDLAVIKKKLKAMEEKEPISEGVDKVIREMQAAIVGAVVASSVAATSSH